MESISLLRVSSSLPKSPLNAPSFTIPMTASWPRFDLGKPLFPQLSYGGSTRVLASSSWNLNVRGRVLARFGNAYSGQANSDAKEDPLKSLLSLKQAKGKDSQTSITIFTTKNEALKLVLKGKYAEADRHMKRLCDRGDDLVCEARVAYVQILIHIDEYQKALEILEEDSFPPFESSSDGRSCLFKAVVHTMLDNDKDAEEWWNKYLETLGHGNANKNLITHCRNTDSDGFMIKARDLLKPLLSLKQEKTLSLEPAKDLMFKIIHAKNMALKEVVKGEYNAAEDHMKKLCEAAKGRNLQEELEAHIAYAQILIHLDKYEEALKCITQVEHLFPLTDARQCLYKAIGLTALGDHKDAKICWKTFKKTIHIEGLPEHS